MKLAKIPLKIFHEIKGVRETKNGRRKENTLMEKRRNNGTK